MNGSNLQNSNENQIPKPSTIINANIKLEEDISKQNTHDMNPRDQWENSIENDRPTMEDDKLKTNLNWSWKELGNKQYQECIAPNSSLPELPPEDTTPLNQQQIDERSGCVEGASDNNNNDYMESEEGIF
ncbi:3841_t:CDS:2 [Diversispora eburnea]|uniref:3841_t:CDS:1 n=1 Tax=Diversispora eburnea TaxID=1213867 RepID=A0A9N8YJI2_9GLOM|nr:3841_t:CDS:2 [Diversispora eburnea]